jgi:putative redox protein
MNYKFEKPVAGEIGPEKYRCTITWRNGTLIADEPESSGGKDQGPDPYTLLLSSAVSCILVTLRMYIDRKGWDIPAISVQSNLFQTDKDDKTLTIIDEDIKFLSPVTDEQREKLISIAKACPISKILQGDITIRTFVLNEAETEKQIKYPNDEISVVWKPEFCRHSGRCVTQLPSVFNLQAHPWINMKGASTEDIIAQVNKCPTGALSIQKKSKPHSD